MSVLARPAVDAERLLVDIRTGRFERTLSGVAAAGALITTAEIWTSHDSASFGNRMMWVPIAVMPLVTVAGIGGVISRTWAKSVLPAASALVVANGLQGTFLHARGISQRPGGWKNARYNLEQGPPLFAPLLATVVGGMGLLSALLKREGHDQ